MENYVFWNVRTGRAKMRTDFQVIEPQTTPLCTNRPQLYPNWEDVTNLVDDSWCKNVFNHTSDHNLNR